MGVMVYFIDMSSKELCEDEWEEGMGREEG